MYLRRFGFFCLGFLSSVALLAGLDSLVIPGLADPLWSVIGVHYKFDLLSLTQSLLALGMMGLAALYLAKTLSEDAPTWLTDSTASRQ